MEAFENNQWDKIIVAKQKYFDLRLKSVWEYRDLIGLFVKRDFITYYKQTIFGPLWYVFQPICSTIMYMLIFGTLAQIGTDSIPQILFYFSGTMLWMYFSSCLKDISNVFYNNKALFGKIFFPRLVVPIATTISLIIKLLIQFVVFIVIYIYYIMSGVDIAVSGMIIFVPFIIMWIGFLACGIGMIISSVTTKYRDIALILDFFISLFMYATPVVYPLSEVPSSMKALLCINPVSAPIELFRYIFFGVCTIPSWSIMMSLLFTIGVLVVGILMFNKNERTFVDII